MEEELFEDLMGSVREAGAILRGEREARRRTSFAGPHEGVYEGDGDANEADR